MLNETSILLGYRGWKSMNISYFKTMKKDQLIEYIRILENNWAGEIWRSNLLSQRLQKVCEYLKKQNIPLEKINKIIFIEGENL